MATINLGRIKLVNRGTWSSSNTYAIDDFVQYTDSGVLSTYIAVAASSNEVPSTGGTENANFWKFMSKGTTISVGNNKVVSTDGSGNLIGTTIGSVGQAVKVTSSNTIGFGTAGGVLQVKQWRKLSTINNASGSDSALSSPFDGTASITPSSSGNIILCEWWSTVDHGTTWRSNFARVQYSVGGGTYTGLAGAGQSAYNEGTAMHGNQIFLSAMVNPATTSAVTFRIVVNGHSSGAGGRWGQYNNEGADSSNVAPPTDNSGVNAGHLIRLTEFDANLVTLTDVS